MDYSDWIILKTLGKEKNITQTAEKLFITQPALTYRIQNIEKELETKLLIRTSKGVVFTTQGQFVVEYAEQMIKKYTALKQVVTSVDNEIRGSVTVALSPAFTRNNLGKLLKIFRERYPLVNIYINTYTSSKAIQKLVNDDIQIAVVRGNHDVDCIKHKLNVMPITLLSKEQVDIKDLPNLPYIKYETDITLERDIANWWREHFTSPPKTIMHLNDSFACRQMVESGLGFSILPALERPKLGKNKGFYEIPLTKKNGELLTRTAWLLYKEYTDQIKAAKAFIDFFLEYMAKH